MLQHHQVTYFLGKYWYKSRMEFLKTANCLQIKRSINSICNDLFSNIQGQSEKNRFSMAVTIIWASTWLQGRNEAVTVVSNRCYLIQWRFLSFRGPFSFSGFSFSSWSLSDSNGFSREKIFNSEYSFYHWSIIPRNGSFRFYSRTRPPRDVAVLDFQILCFRPETPV